MAKSKANSKTRKVLLSLLVVIGLSTVIIAYNFYKRIYYPNVTKDAEKENYIYIPTGATFTDVVNLLNAKNLLKNSASFE